MCIRDSLHGAYRMRRGNTGSTVCVAPRVQQLSLMANPHRISVKARNETEELPPSEAAEHLLNECRMVLPGIQALFGFQLVAVFTDGFATKLSSAEQRVHFFAITLVAAAIAIIMT